MTLDRPNSRRNFLRGATAALALAHVAGRLHASASATGTGTGTDPALRYLEAVTPATGTPYLAPSALHPAYSHAVYVNAATSGPHAQKMWVIARAGDGWSLLASDDSHWSGREMPDGGPGYSWPVSTGRKYPGDSRSGPTPLGIFNVDDRRHRPGWGSPGMYNALYIDLHYSSGRASGVAIHGTTSGQYRKLGRVDSHGCVRMRQSNADLIWNLIHPDGVRGAASPLWGEIPRYFTSAVGTGMTPRRGYVRDGSLLRDASGALLTREGYRMVFVFFWDAA
ncbi:L,D-transpeptidase [Pseudooceanicola nanhaiensis]|uniref:L,D-transpeptidase n=1 Tax=Pseudooceanicola nanhaiensis TaxID=375761 RepID=UPI001CD744B5|nr:L,D-transpeptidase family protein [Pseudooceanicola nanhaiensis]MCA0921169.1 L,D-transpeptidase family protein [Pseudooceanicola nanhaiensis]